MQKKKNYCQFWFFFKKGCGDTMFGENIYFIDASRDVSARAHKLTMWVAEHIVETRIIIFYIFFPFWKYWYDLSWSKNRHPLMIFFFQKDRTRMIVSSVYKQWTLLIWNNIIKFEKKSNQRIFLFIIGKQFYSS